MQSNTKLRPVVESENSRYAPRATRNQRGDRLNWIIIFVFLWISTGWAGVIALRWLCARIRVRSFDLERARVVLSQPHRAIAIGVVFGPVLLLLAILLLPLPLGSLWQAMREVLQLAPNALDNQVQAVMRNIVQERG